jgi:hypothetical protein
MTRLTKAENKSVFGSVVSICIPGCFAMAFFYYSLYRGGQSGRFLPTTQNTAISLMFLVIAFLTHTATRYLAAKKVIQPSNFLKQRTQRVFFYVLHFCLVIILVLPLLHVAKPLWLYSMGDLPSDLLIPLFNLRAINAIAFLSAGMFLCVIAAHGKNLLKSNWADGCFSGFLAGAYLGLMVGYYFQLSELVALTLAAGVSSLAGTLPRHLARMLRMSSVSFSIVWSCVLFIAGWCIGWLAYTTRLLSLGNALLMPRESQVDRFLPILLFVTMGFILTVAFLILQAAVKRGSVQARHPHSCSSIPCIVQTILVGILSAMTVHICGVVPFVGLGALWVIQLFAERRSAPACIGTACIFGGVLLLVALFFIDIVSRPYVIPINITVMFLLLPIFVVWQVIVNRVETCVECGQECKASWTVCPWCSKSLAREQQ